jgi:hypothetical protein
LKVGGVKLRVFKDWDGISKWLVVQGGLVKFPFILLLLFSLCLLCQIRTATFKAYHTVVASESTQFGSGVGFLVMLNPLCRMLLSAN